MHELELNDATAVGALIELCTKEILDQKTRSNTIDLIIKAKNTQKMVVSLDTLDFNGNLEKMPLAELSKLLAKLVAVEDGATSLIDKRVEIPSKGVGRGRAKTLQTSFVRQELPRSIVSGVKTLDKYIR